MWHVNLVSLARHQTTPFPFFLIYLVGQKSIKSSEYGELKLNNLHKNYPLAWECIFTDNHLVTVIRKNNPWERTPLATRLYFRRVVLRLMRLWKFRLLDLMYQLHLPQELPYLEDPEHLRDLRLKIIWNKSILKSHIWNEFLK